LASGIVVVVFDWAVPETSEFVLPDLIHAAQLGFIRPEEFRKNAVKFGWELWDQNPEKTAQSSVDTRRIEGVKNTES
jgi:hypothetical protein